MSKLTTFLPIAEVSVKMIHRVAIQLGDELRSQVIFVGGATTPLLITDPAAADVRPTKDVDIVVEMMSYLEYGAFSEILRNKGFNEDAEGTPPVICRWTMEDLIVDIMPTDPKILGFSNRWYEPSFRSATHVNLDSDNNIIIQLISPPYFLATKLEAFADRGNNDFCASHDLEDIITVVDGRPELVEEIQNDNNQGLREFLGTKIASFLENSRFSEAVEGHLGDKDRLNTVLTRLNNIAHLR